MLLVQLTEFSRWRTRITHLCKFEKTENRFAHCWLVDESIYCYFIIFRVKPEESVVLAPDLLKGLFHVLTIEGSEENEYAMKAIMTSFVALQENIVPFLSELIPKLTQLLIVVAKNPSRPRFNHYLFETLSLSIKWVYEYFKNVFQKTFKPNTWTFLFLGFCAEATLLLWHHLSKHCSLFSKKYCSRTSKVRIIIIFIFLFLLKNNFLSFILEF